MFGNLNPPARKCAFTFAFLQFLALQCLSGVGYGVARPQEQQGQALGSLTTVGEVYVNDATAPADSTIFAGDTLRTSGTGTATFTLSGKGSFQISPNTEIAFAGPQYAAELKFGKVAMSSLNGATGINLRTGSSVVVAVAEGEQSTSNIEAPSDGSFVVTCVSGSVGIIPLGGGKGIFIRMGQSANISAQGQLFPMSREVSGAKPEAAPPLAAPISEEPVPAARQKHGYMRWVLIGAGVAGAGVAAAILTANGSGAASSVPAISSSSSFPPSDPAPISSPAPSQPTPAPPSQPAPPPSPGHNCPHDDKSCKPHIVIGLAFHF